MRSKSSPVSVLFYVTLESTLDINSCPEPAPGWHQLIVIGSVYVSFKSSNFGYLQDNYIFLKNDQFILFVAIICLRTKKTNDRIIYNIFMQMRK